MAALLGRARQTKGFAELETPVQMMIDDLLCQNVKPT
jgi:hypothetical protein